MWKELITTESKTRLNRRLEPVRRELVREFEGVADCIQEAFWQE